MTFRLAFQISADASTAKAELAGTEAAARKTGAAATDLGRKGAQAAGGTRTLGRAASATAAEVHQLANAERIAATQAVGLGRANHLAAGGMGNLTAQFNDIGVMLMAGQNPLQLAIQQGTQITQVIGPMGAAGAVRALGGAFLGMLNPVSLITIGSIAAGAAMFQWLTEVGEKVETLEEKFDSLDDAVTAFDAATKGRNRPFADLIEEFGAYATEAAKLLEVQRQLAYIDAASTLSATAQGLTSMFGTLERVNLEGAKTADFLKEIEQRFGDLSPDGVARVADALGISTDAAILLTRQMVELQDAKGPEGQAAALRNVIEQLELATGGAYQMDDATRAVYAQLLEAEKAALRLAGVDIASGISAAGDEARRVADEIVRALGASQALANQGIGDLRESEIRLKYVDDPVATAGALARERMRGEQGVRRLGAEGGELSALDAEVEAYARNMEAIARNNGVRQQGTKASREERDAIARLIASEQEQLAVLRETDPVQKEMLRNREALAGATDAERQQVEALIAARIRESAAAEALQQGWEFLGSTAYDALEGIILKGESAGEVMENLAQSILRAGLQAMILGKGPLAGFLGVSGPIWGGLAGAAGSAPAYAGGGLISGPGSGTSDNILMWGSSGEFMMNARSTARYRHVLEAMNAGATIPGFAAGGPIGDSAMRPSLRGEPAASGTLRIELAEGLVASFLDKASAQAVRIVETGIAQYDRNALPQRVLQVSGDSRRRG